MDEYNGIDECDPTSFDRTDLKRTEVDDQTVELSDAAGKLVARRVVIGVLPSPLPPRPNRLIRS